MWGVGCGVWGVRCRVCDRDFRGKAFESCGMWGDDTIAAVVLLGQTLARDKVSVVALLRALSVPRPALAPARTATRQLFCARRLIPAGRLTPRLFRVGYRICAERRRDWSSWLILG